VKVIEIKDYIGNISAQNILSGLTLDGIQELAAKAADIPNATIKSNLKDGYTYADIPANCFSTSGTMFARCIRQYTTIEL
jgi:hypothetical protein